MNEDSIERIMADSLSGVSPATRELAYRHRGMLLTAARDVASQLRLQGHFAGLFMFAVRGFVQAVERFDARPGASFTTFAWYRVRGAVVDGARMAGWARRDRPPRGDGEWRFVSSGLPLVGGGSPDEDESDVPDPDDFGFEVVFEEVLERARRAVRVREAVAELPEPGRTLVRRCDLGGESLQGVARSLGISVGWASRHRQRCYGQLRVVLRDLAPSRDEGEVRPSVAVCEARVAA